MNLGIDTVNEVLPPSNFNIGLDEYLKSKFDLNDESFIHCLPKSLMLPNICPFSEELDSDFDLIESLILDSLSIPISLDNLPGSNLSHINESHLDLSRLNMPPHLGLDVFDAKNMDAKQNADTLYSDVFKYLNLNSASKARIGMIDGLEYLKGGSALGIDDVTYDKFETQKIKSVLANTGKFDTQVDVNDFIRQTAGFKSLLPESLLPNNGEKSNDMLFDMIKFASNFKNKNQSNNDAVSVIYKLFSDDTLSSSSQRDNFSALPYDPVRSFKEQSFKIPPLKLPMSTGFDAPTANLFANLMLGGNKLDSLSGLNLNDTFSNTFSDPLNDTFSGTFSKNLDLSGNAGIKRAVNLDDGLDLDTSFNLDNIKLNDVCDDVMLLGEIRDLLKQVCDIDLERDIVEPLSICLSNIETAINSLSDVINLNSKNESLKSDIDFGKMGNSISQIP
ncbi:hypothetical protein [Borrelia persica]|uniref:hypothetical protein n=1 Tax=Borrelia persica TaxID=44448 RepID=UPI0004672195|nr:hypothetical protein [Borrelia persica]